MAKNNAIDIDIETGGGNTYTFPSATSTLATLDLAETLTNKDLSDASNTLGSANVAAAGALMESEVINLAQVKAFDSTDYATSDQGTKADNALQARGAVNAQTGTTYTLVIGDEYLLGVTMNNAAANTITIPTNASVAFPIGTTILITQLGAGATTIAAAGGVTTVVPADSPLLIGAVGGSRVIQKRATNEWLII